MYKFILSLQVIMYAAALLTILLIIPSMAQDTCRAVALQKPRSGYRCVTKNYTTITQVSRHLCTHLCMHESCILINYNHEKSYCQMGYDGCWKLIGDPQFTVTTSSFPLALTESPCIQWVPVADVVDDKAIPCDPNSSYRVGRLVLLTDTLVGKFGSIYTEAWKEGGIYRNADETEVMQVQSDCSADWVAYTPGDPFPAGTVIGGYLSDPCTRTPIIRGLTSGNYYRCGYYNSNTQFGYMIFIMPEVTTEMDILVLV